jgi:hypothetical protein
MARSTWAQPQFQSVKIMTPTILIQDEPLALAKRDMLPKNNGTPLKRPNGGEHATPEGFSYVPNLPRPAPQDGFRFQRLLTATEYGWEAVAIPVTVPTPVSMAQFREELSKPTYNNETGVSLRVIVQQAVEASGIVMLDWWDTAGTVERENDKVLEMAEALGVTDETLDAIFTGASLN